MADLWHPRATRIQAPRDAWGKYADGTPFRGVLHTTETDTYTPSTASYFGHQSWPHSTIGPARNGKWQIWQHIPINFAARALKNAPGGVHTNLARAVQTEIVFRAAKTRDLPDAAIETIADWMRWVEDVVGVKRRAAKFFGADAGFTLASADAKQRMSASAWNAFDGWCGHQHAPENDHWDPGAIPIDRLLAHLGDDDVSLTPEQATQLAETWQRVKNLEAVADRDIDTLKPIIEQVLQKLQDGPQGSRGRPGTIDADAFVKELKAALKRK